ncbi:MAG: aspartate aminotransferase family protein [Ignavibacteria bacterium]|nr:aspartate aminotransferase family protein [Ignavibacteria bacterium]
MQPDTKISHLLANYSRHNVEFTRGEGYFLFDAEGKRYLDFLAGIAVSSFGHNHKSISEAVNNQLNNIWHTSNLFSISLQEEVASKLAKSSGLDKVFFCNSGTEANEAAIKFARKWGKSRTEIISMQGGFHGRSLGSLSATAEPKYREGFQPLLPGFSFASYDSIDELKSMVTPDTCAIMLEPIQGESGIIVPSSGYLQAVRELCDEKNILLIIDEVQSGIGRTGKFFAYQWEEIRPDIITVAKGIANGLPLGAVICTEQVANNMVPGTHGSTFGGNPVALAAANQVLSLIDLPLLCHIQTTGQYLIDQIKALNSPFITDVRGKGLMIGITLIKGLEVKNIVAELLEKGIVTCSSGNNTLRLLPPFIIDNLAVNEFLAVFGELLLSMKKQYLLPIDGIY